MGSVAWEVITDVLSDRVLPLIIARASHSVLHPLDWGAWELVVLGVFTQVGLEFYRHGVPKAFGSWAHLPARGRLTLGRVFSQVQSPHISPALPLKIA